MRVRRFMDTQTYIVWMQLLQSLNAQNTLWMQCDYELMCPTRFTCGVLQGCPLCGTWLIFAMHRMLEELVTALALVGGRERACVDDVGIVASSRNRRGGRAAEVGQPGNGDDFGRERDGGR